MPSSSFRSLFLSLSLSLLFVFSLGSESPLFSQYEEAETEMEEIDVRGQVRREELKTTSATILTNEDVQSRVYYNPLEMIKNTPGVFIGFYGESGIAPVFSIRGFAAGHASAGGDVTMYLDGIPLHDNGHTRVYLDTGMIMPIEVESIEVIKGPSSVYYGQHAAGGSIPIQGIKGGNLTRLNLRYGSYNNIDVSGLLARDINKFSQVYAFEVFHTDGYRENSNWDKQTFSGRWTYHFSDRFSASLNLRAYKADWDSAGYISKLQAKSDKDWVNDGSGEGNGGNRERYDARLWANWFIDDESQLTYYLYGSTLEHTRYQIRQPLLGATPRAGTMQNNTHKSWGTGLTYNFNGDLLGRRSTATVGLTYMYEREDPDRRYNIPWGQGRKYTPIPTSYETYDISNPSLLAEFTYQILERLNLRIGGRYDWLDGEYFNHITGVKSESKGFSFFSPKAGILYEPWDFVQIYASFGRAFNTPGIDARASGADLYAGEPFALKTRDQIEIGARVNVANWLNLDLALFTLDTKNDDTYDEEEGVTTPTGSSVRRGIEFSATARPHKDFIFRGNYTYMDATYDEYSTAAFDYHGRRLLNLPRHTTNLEAAYAPQKGFGARLSFHWEADALSKDDPPYNRTGALNTDPYRVFKVQDKGSLDLQLNYRFNEHYRLVLDVTNLLDKKYYYKSDATPNIVTGDYTYAPLQPLQIFLALEMNWDKK
jgi:iron complex outermembrane receptor protein